MSKPAPPKVSEYKDKVSVLERRMAFLQDKINRRYFSNGAEHWTRAELAALKSAVECLKYCRSLY